VATKIKQNKKEGNSMKLNIIQKTGKITGKLVSATKAAPTKTKSGLTSAKDQFKNGFNAGVSSGS